MRLPAGKHYGYFNISLKKSQTKKNLPQVAEKKIKNYKVAGTVGFWF
jgi:hypothetical protein